MADPPPVEASEGKMVTGVPWQLESLQNRDIERLDATSAGAPPAAHAARHRVRRLTTAGPLGSGQRR